MRTTLSETSDRLYSQVMSHAGSAELLFAFLILEALAEATIEITSRTLAALPARLSRAPRPTTAYPHAPHTLGLPWVAWVRMGPRVVACGSGTLSSGQSLVVVAVVTTDHIVIEQNWMM